MELQCHLTSAYSNGANSAHWIGANYGSLWLVRKNKESRTGGLACVSEACLQSRSRFTIER